MSALGGNLCPRPVISYALTSGLLAQAEEESAGRAGGVAIRRTYILTFNVFYFALGRCYIVTLSRCHVFDFRYLADDEGVRCLSCCILTFNV